MGFNRIIIPKEVPSKKLRSTKAAPLAQLAEQLTLNQ